MPGKWADRSAGLTRQQRGYGNDWTKVRNRILASEPFCRMCATKGRSTPATDVDHIQPFRGIDDPRRLNPTNLRPLCRPCHAARTIAQAGGKVARPIGHDGWPT